MGDAPNSQGLLLSKLTPKDCAEEGAKMGRTGCLLQGADEASPTQSAKGDHLLATKVKTKDQSKAGAKAKFKKDTRVCVCDRHDAKKSKVVVPLDSKQLYVHGPKECAHMGELQGYTTCKLTDQKDTHLSLAGTHIFEYNPSAPKMTAADIKAANERSEKDEIAEEEADRLAKVKENKHKNAYWVSLTSGYEHSNDKEISQKKKEKAEQEAKWSAESQRQAQVWTGNAALRVQAGLLESTRADHLEDKRQKQEMKQRQEADAAAAKLRRDLEKDAKARQKAVHKQMEHDRQVAATQKQVADKKQRAQEMYFNSEEYKRKHHIETQKEQVKAAQRQVERMNKKLAREEAQRQEAVGQMTQVSAPSEEKAPSEAPSDEEALPAKKATLWHPSAAKVADIKASAAKTEAAKSALQKKQGNDFEADRDACERDCAAVKRQQALEAKADAAALRAGTDSPSQLLQALQAKVGASCECDAVEQASRSSGYDMSLWVSV